MGGRDGSWTATLPRARGEEDGAEPEPAGRIGRFAILRLLGQGGMGRVYVGYDDELDRKVAIKLLRGLGGERAAARLRREAQALARLSDPNVVQVHEIGTHEGSVFVAMELVEGQTLGVWAAQSERSWEERLDALIQAGRGLAAAHAAGLVHRDFKPDNVLVGGDGRVRVLDFGLVGDVGDMGHEAEDEAGSSEAPGTSAMSPSELTEQGTIMGTPAYMAPEQHAARKCDGAADQFSFCVSAFELLYGERPFEAAPLRALAEAKQRGAVVAVPKSSAVPARVRDAISRGLSPEPEQRWPDMGALLAEFEGARSRRARWLVPVVVGLGLGAGLLLAFAWPREPEAQPCAVDPQALAGVWDPARSEALRSSFAATGLDFAPRAAELVEQRLDDWSRSWSRQERDSCRATRLRGTQSEAMLDLRSACFERQRSEARALIDLLVTADASVVARSASLVTELPDLGACSSSALGAGSVPRLDPALRGRADELYEALARARAQLELGRVEQARALAEDARRAADELDYLPLELEAEVVLARISIGAGSLDEGLERLRAAALAGERAQLWDFVAGARVELARAAAGDFAEPRLERWMIDEAQLALERVDRPVDPREVTLEVARARVAEQAGDYEAALAAHERAWALGEGRLSEQERTKLRIGVGTTLLRSGEYERARVELERSLASARASLGPDAPQVARIEFNLGTIAAETGEFESARRYFEDVRRVDLAAWGGDSLELARDRFALAFLDFSTGELERGCATIEEVREVYERELGLRHDETAQALSAAAVCRAYSGDPEGALHGYRQALAIQRELLGELHPDVGLQHYNIGDAALALGRLDDAQAAFERARLVFELSLPPDHPELGLALGGLGRVRVERGDFSGAAPALEDALELAGEEQPPAELGELEFALARALIELEGERGRAAGLASSALARFQAAALGDRAAEVERWLAKRRVPETP